MKNLLLLTLILSLSPVNSQAFGPKRSPVPTPTPVATATPSPSSSPSPTASPTVSPSPTPSPSPGQGPKFVLGPNVGSNVDRVFAQKAVDIMNRHVASGCLKEKFQKRSVTSLHNVEGVQVKTKEEAYNKFLANAPYKLDLRWYKKSFSNVIGYTYNWLDGMDADRCYNKSSPQCPTETKIYSNTNIISGYSAGDYAAHLIHELSHQARAGGFVHWTVFDGSTPYEIGYAMDDCVYAPAKGMKQEQRAPSKFKKTMQLHTHALKAVH